MTKETDWQERYQTEDTPWDKGEPAPGLVDWLKKQTLDPDARVLVPGCGRGHDASAWAKAGFDTTGMDLAEIALSDAREKYESLPNLAFFPGNFLDEKPQEPYDVIFEHTLYCAIDPVRREDYAKSLPNWLKPGGYFLAIHFIFPLDEEGPPFGASKDEIINRFQTNFTLRDDWKPRHFEGRKNEEWMFLWQRKT
jgi:cyclopropane fatty-acyl-phospholipid synthase-like methyltransferase